MPSSAPLERPGSSTQWFRTGIYHAGVRRIRRFIDSDVIGRPTSIHCDFFLAPRFSGFR
jgi:predicted dehydrogenase